LAVPKTSADTIPVGLIVKFNLAVPKVSAEAIPEEDMVTAPGTTV
jgi:hypothetical protein